MTYFVVGDIVTPKKRLAEVRCGHPYNIVEIRRGIDGVYDWDDLFLEGKTYTKFCEFDFQLYDSNDQEGK